MDRVDELERQRVQRLAASIVPRLRERGVVADSTSEVESVERWRRTARRAGRILGWRVRTGVSADGARLWVVSEDFPVSPEAHERVAKLLDDLLLD